jgi:hypothetical protein
MSMSSPTLDGTVQVILPYSVGGGFHLGWEGGG